MLCGEDETEETATFSSRVYKSKLAFLLQPKPESSRNIYFCA
jgi:hypothetical protein